MPEFSYQDTGAHWCECGAENRYSQSEVMDGQEGKCVRCNAPFVFFVRDGSVWVEDVE